MAIVDAIPMIITPSARALDEHRDLVDAVRRQAINFSLAIGVLIKVHYFHENKDYLSSLFTVHGQTVLVFFVTKKFSFINEVYYSL